MSLVLSLVFVLLGYNCSIGIVKFKLKEIDLCSGMDVYVKFGVCLEYMNGNVFILFVNCCVSV